MRYRETSRAGAPSARLRLVRGSTLHRRDRRGASGANGRGQWSNRGRLRLAPWCQRRADRWSAAGPRGYRSGKYRICRTCAAGRGRPHGDVALTQRRWIARRPTAFGMGFTRLACHWVWESGRSLVPRGAKTHGTPLMKCEVWVSGSLEPKTGIKGLSTRSTVVEDRALT